MTIPGVDHRVGSWGTEGTVGCHSAWVLTTSFLSQRKILVDISFVILGGFYLFNVYSNHTTLSSILFNDFIMST
jgi:hypothetical protein